MPMPKIIPTVPPLPPGLADVLHEVVFAEWGEAFLETESGKRGRNEVLTGRFEAALRFTIPWLSEHIDLENARIVEIGCGSGSSTAALGLHSKWVEAYDIDERSVRAAAARCEAYGLKNVALHTVDPESLLSTVVGHAKDVDVFVLYAVLEHLTYRERLDTLSTLWKALEPGGSLVVVETPNRFTYVDGHTTESPFFHLLPDELAFAWVDRVSRVAFKDAIRQSLAKGPEEASLTRIRWGLGASYHEFRLAIDEPLDEIVVADGFEREMTDFFHEGADEALLVKFFRDHPVPEPIGFARGVLNFILRKPRNEEDRASARAFNEERRKVIGAPPPPPPPPPPPRSPTGS